MSQTHEFKVEMTCDGCKNAVERVLGKLKDQVEKVEISVEKRQVLVTSALESDQLLEQIKKTGKETSYVGIKAAN